MNKTTVYRVFEQNDYEGTETTLKCFWNLAEAEAFADEHNRYANERDAWIKKSFEWADQNKELREKRREHQALSVRLAAMSKTDAEYAVLKKEEEELSLLTHNMLENICSMWKVSNPFQTTALPQNGEAFIEDLIVE